jgi:NAD(P)H dehydrogenase (quinone)
MGLNQSVAHGAVVGAAGEGRIVWATRRDFAEAAAAVLATDGHEGKIYELAGDQAHTLSELAAEASRHSGKPVAYNNLSKADYSALLVSFGLPAPVAESLAATDAEAVPAGLLDTDSKDLSRLIGRPTSTLSDAVAAALRA